MFVRRNNGVTLIFIYHLVPRNLTLFFDKAHIHSRPMNPQKAIQKAISVFCSSSSGLIFTEMSFTKKYI